MDSPQQTNEYARYYYFKRLRMLLGCAFILALVATGIWLTYKYLANPNYAPDWNEWMTSISQMRGRKSGGRKLFVFLLLVFLSLPFWLKTPPTILLIGELISFAICRLLWAFDKRPDFAIGPSGIYGLSYLTYYRLSWSQISFVALQSTQWVPNWLSFGHHRHIVFRTRLKTTPSKLLFWRKPQPIELVLHSLHFDIDDILLNIRRFAPIRTEGNGYITFSNDIISRQNTIDRARKTKGSSKAK